MFATHATTRRRDHQPGAGGHRHRAVGLALPPRRPAAVAGRRRREAAHPGLHHRRRLAAPDAPTTIVRETLAAQEAGFKGAKVKVGMPHVSDDVARLKAVRDAVGDGFEIMVDANQCFTLERSAAPRAALCRTGHRLVRGAAAGRRHQRPRAAGRRQRGADRGRRVAVLAEPVRGLCAAGRGSILQVDVARIGGITPWLKVAHLAETFNLAVCPHFLMELHVSADRAPRRARRGSNTSRSSTPWPKPHGRSSTAMPSCPTRRAWASTGVGIRSRHAPVPRIA